MNLRIITAAAVAVFVAAVFAQQTYRIREGDTLSGVAAKTGSEKSAIAAANGIKNENRLQVGQTLTIPTAERVNIIDTPKVRVNRDAVVIRKGPSLDSPKVSVTGKGVEAWVKGRKGAWYLVKFTSGVVGYVRGDFLNEVGSSAKTVPAVQKKSTYKVTKGDNDNTIARKHGITVAALHNANPGIKWSRLQIGQLLSLPAKAKTVTASGERINYIKTWTVKVNKDFVVVRTGPSTRSAKVTTVGLGTKATVLGRNGAWYKLKFPKGTTGYIRGDYLNAAHPEQTSSVMVARNTRSSKTRAVSASGRKSSTSGTKYMANLGPGSTDVVEEALKHLGTRYKWGGTSTSGFDCSGFVKYVYGKSEGVKMPRTSKEQARFGTPVPRSQLRPGDVISFASRGGSRVNHSGIYIGNGKFVHASSGRGQVRVDSLDGHYGKRYVAAHRVVKKPAEKKAEPKPQAPKEEAAKTETKPETKTETPAEKDKQEPKKEGGN